MRYEEIARVAWRVTHDAPVIRPPALSPLIADPTFLLPHDTPDGRWHLFAHSVWGVHRFTSMNGIAWTHHGLAVRHAMRAFLLQDAGTYHLFYERYAPWRLPLSWLPRLGWRSWIERRTSRDLVRWSAPAAVLEATLAWHREPARGRAVGNPCVVRAAEGWRLYYSAGLVHVPDCGFDEPRHIGWATAPSLDGPWTPHPEPMLSPAADDARANLGAGAIKVLRLDDGFAGFQNGIAFDPASGRSRSAISLLVSPDGFAWTHAHPRPIVEPTSGWRARFVYACDVRRDSASGRWYLYFNGRDHAALPRGREAIGFVVGGP